MICREEKIRFRQENGRLNEEERSLQKEILKSYPINVVLPTGTRCNNRCIFCTDRSPQNSFGYADFPFEDFVKLCEPLEYATSVGLYGWGEPLLNPDYEKMFDYVVENVPGIEITVSTNGISMNNQWAHKFASTESLTINISLNAATAKTYLHLSQNDQFDRITENIRRLIHLRNRNNRNSPQVALSFVAIKENITELPDFVRLSAQLGVDRVVVQDLILLNETLREHSLTPFAEFAKSIFGVTLDTAREVGVHLLPFVPVYFLPVDSESFDADRRLEMNISTQVCIEPWIYLRVSAEGVVKICCYSNESMGNMYTQTLAEIWNGEKYRYFRNRVNTGNLPEDCRRCPKKVGLTW